MQMKKEAKRPRGGATYPCPHCGGPTHVLTTRKVEEGIRRRRKCRDFRCGSVFPTLEEAKK